MPQAMRLMRGSWHPPSPPTGPGSQCGAAGARRQPSSSLTALLTGLQGAARCEQSLPALAAGCGGLCPAWRSAHWAARMGGAKGRRVVGEGTKALTHLVLISLVMRNYCVTHTVHTKKAQSPLTWAVSHGLGMPRRQFTGYFKPGEIFQDAFDIVSRHL